MRSRRLTFALGGFALVALILAVACGSSPTSPTPGGGGTPDVTITIVGMNGAQSFSPNPVTVQAGQKVAWRNNDSVSHTATGDAGGFDTGIIAAGATSGAITMPSSGTFAYHCTLHPTMVGTLTVQ